MSSDYYVTFGQGSPSRNHYVKIKECDKDSARAITTSMFHNRWAFIYSEDEFLPNIGLYGLTRLFTVERNKQGFWTAHEEPYGVADGVRSIG